jgi:ACS family glucarate transporter-like MFS transporter
VPQVTTNCDFRTARRVQASVVGLMVSLSVMNFFDRIVMSIAGPGIMKEFGLSETQMGSVFSAFNFGYAIFMVPGGLLADR